MAILRKDEWGKVIELPCGKVVEYWRNPSATPSRTCQTLYTDRAHYRKCAAFFIEDDGSVKQRTREYWLRAERTYARQRIAELEAQLNTRNLAVERDGDPLREKFQSALDRYGEAMRVVGTLGNSLQDLKANRETADKVRDELDARLSTLVDTVRVLVRDNQAQQAELRRYKDAVMSAGAWLETVVELRSDDPLDSTHEALRALQVLKGSPE